MRHFNTSGPCVPRLHYMLPPEPRLPGARPYIDSGKYFVVHAPRQTGKTTTLTQLAHALTAEGGYAAMLLSCERAQAARRAVLSPCSAPDRPGQLTPNMAVMELSSICVYCGSSLGTDPDFEVVARETGELIARNGITLVYGGACVGLMGVVADAALGAGGQVIGVTPRGLWGGEIDHPGLTQLIEVGSMHERKQRLSELADAFVALPGGLGTLDELAEIATWSQLGLHRKPIVTLDVNGYWSGLHTFLRTAAEAGLLKQQYLDLIMNVDGGPDALLPALRSYVAPPSGKWIQPVRD